MIPNAPKISVCIVTYRRDADLMKSLERLEKSTFQDYEILIVDNGGSHELPGLLERAGIAHPVRLFHAADNRGCANLNLLFPEAHGSLIACFDDDSFPREDCLERAWQLFEKNPDMGMIGFKMHLPETGEPWHDPWWNPESNQPRPTVFCPGCGLAFRNDPRLPSELCIPEIVSQAHELSMAAEIARLGYRIEFRPECIAYHPDTTQGYSGKKAEGGTLNQLIFLMYYSGSFYKCLLLATHWIVKSRGLPNNYDFVSKHFKSPSNRALDRKTMRRFQAVLQWHIHPWFQKLIYLHLKP
jgi:glycosyltransferase involved in cell wall biosynthesis